MSSAEVRSMKGRERAGHYGVEQAWLLVVGSRAMRPSWKFFLELKPGCTTKARWVPQDAVAGATGLAGYLPGTSSLCKFGEARTMAEVRGLPRDGRRRFRNGISMDDYLRS